MARWERVVVPPDFAGDSRAERQGGSYLRYHPDLLCSVSNALAPEVVELAADVSVSLARLSTRLQGLPVGLLRSTSLRSESIASSWIEGVRATPRALAITQIGDEAASSTAHQVARNVVAMGEAIEVLGRGAWTHDHLLALHQDLLPWQARSYRTGQVWIGGTNKLNADYAAPPAEKVRDYVEDLLAYANGSGDLPVVQAAIVHAQFETIHPFDDGNGRVGRALVHGLLHRAGLAEGAVVPLSTVLRHDVAGYVDALTGYRYDGDERAPALSAYVGRFLAFLELAVVRAQHFADAAAAIHDRWRAAVAGVRSDAAIHRAIDLVAENPVVSARFLADRLAVSDVAAHHLIAQLVRAGIVKPASGKFRRSALYQADEVLDLLAYGAEAGARTPAAPSLTSTDISPLILRCGRPTRSGPCGNRVLDRGTACWRHR